MKLLTIDQELAIPASCWKEMSLMPEGLLSDGWRPKSVEILERGNEDLDSIEG